MSKEETTSVIAIPEFDTLAFFSEIESQETISKKIKVLNRVLDQESNYSKNMNDVLRKKGQNTSKSTDYDYIPIEIVEESLRQVFFRQIDYIIKNSYRDLNTFIVVATLRYKDPVTNEYRELDGIGGKALMQNAGAQLNDFNMTMKRNALELGIGIAYSRAVKNAAKKLGKLFGADLNRDEEIENVTVFNKEALTDPNEKLEILKELFNKIDHSKIKPNEVSRIQDVIDKKEKASYSKAIQLLKKYDK